MKPLDADRALVLRRDLFRCVRCGKDTALEMQHRRRVGAGGSKVRPPVTDLVTACSWCNEGFEGVGQTEALVYGHKVRSWVVDPGRVPLFNRPLRVWGRLTDAGGVIILQPQDAMDAMRSVYGTEWDRWADQLREPLGLMGRGGAL